MTDLKRIAPHKILWLDLEMTGLNPQTDRILEVAAIVTDWDFTEQEIFESGVGGDPKATQNLLDANAFYTTYPENKKKLFELAATSPPLEMVEQQLVGLIDRHFTNEPALLGGNSIHMDRQFIRKWWPYMDQRLHYRMLDVSAWKVVMTGKYGLEFTKSEAHRALDDVRESIAELQFYLQKGDFNVES